MKDGALVITAGSCAAGTDPAPTPSTPTPSPSSSTDDKEEVSSALGASPSYVTMTIATLATVKRCPLLGLSAGLLAAVSTQADNHCSVAMEVEVHADMTQ